MRHTEIGTGRRNGGVKETEVKWGGESGAGELGGGASGERG